MTLMLRLQVFAIVVAAASLVFDHVALGDAAPPANRLANDLVFGAFLAWWIGSICWIRWRGVEDDTPDGWYPHNLAVFWLGNAATVATFWLLLPHADETARLTAAMMLLGPVTVEVIGTVRTPPGRRGVLGDWAPLGIPAGVVPWFVLSEDSFKWTVSLFMAAFCAMLLLLREFLQSAVDDAYAAKAEAEAARDSKARFLAAASHDLGQPLQAARLFLDQLVRAPEGTKRRAAAERVNWAFDSMEQQLRQILDHLKLEARQVRPAIGDVRLGPLMARVTEMHEPAARMAGVSIVAAPTSLAVRGDPALIERAVGNYLSNAIRHAQARRVLLGVRRRGARVRLWVMDDGRGVADTEQAGLFEEYVQGAWSARNEVRGGFGLGLASARRMAELMGGGAGHEPRWRCGSAFWLELPATERLASR